MLEAFMQPRTALRVPFEVSVPYALIHYPNYTSLRFAEIEMQRALLKILQYFNFLFERADSRRLSSLICIVCLLNNIKMNKERNQRAKHGAFESHRSSNAGDT